MNFGSMNRPDKEAFLDAESIEQVLSDMEKDAGLKTIPSLIKESSNSMRIISFKEKHTSYLKDHPKVIPQAYLANLRTMIKIRA